MQDATEPLVEIAVEKLVSVCHAVWCTAQRIASVPPGRNNYAVCAIEAELAFEQAVGELVLGY